MSKNLVCYFSASGVTKNVAEKISEATNAEIFEIEPKEKYSAADLNWMDPSSRSSIEMKNRDFRPEVKYTVENLKDYDLVIIGFPVWWYTAPTIINTFIEQNDLRNKKIYVFVTSGSSGADGSFKDLKNKYKNLNFISAKRFNGKENKNIYTDWIK